MKNYIALAALLAAGTAVANAATDLYVSSTASGDLLAVNADGYFTNLTASDGTLLEAQAILTALKTSGNTDYNLVLSSGQTDFSVNDALSFNQVWTNGDSTGYTIDFGTSGSITAATDYNNWGGAIRFTNGVSVTFKVTVSADQLTPGELFSRDLMVAPATSAGNVTGMWNVVDKLSLDVTGLDGYTNAEEISDVSGMTTGSYGYVVTGGDSLAFVVKAIPEPSAFGMLAGLGALALVASRRRRK